MQPITPTLERPYQLKPLASPLTLPIDRIPLFVIHFPNLVGYYDFIIPLHEEFEICQFESQWW